MPKKDYKAQMEQMKIDEVGKLAERVNGLMEENYKLRIVNASLQERLRLVEIAARGE